MNDNTKKRKSHFQIDDLIDNSVNNALLRRSEAILPMSDEEAASISGGTTTLLHPTVHGVVINPKPTPCPPIIHGVVINPKPTPCPPIIHGIVLGIVVQDS